MRSSLRGTREKEVEKGQRDLASKVGLRKDGDAEEGDPAAALSSIRKASKLSDLEGRSHRNNIRIYGVSENAEGSSMPRFIENLIKTELGDLLELNQGDDLGIERAHRALTPRPPAGMPPRSIVVRFLQFTTKEKILHAAWKKKILVEEGVL
ncbi:LINE-1 type transposase domain-containing 1 [Labeo rohita]|uniref:LINE-1 type transposase domain-containing 1 n=1 Tax=Labeo rohita TaxID=84645 RepID=A0A498NLK7_LABRO|nr:LINE-1 type transposase domain-containing 1 [Labeo rohita]